MTIWASSWRHILAVLGSAAAFTAWAHGGPGAGEMPAPAAPDGWSTAAIARATAEHAARRRDHRGLLWGLHAIARAGQI